jgi:hypothetical protein
MLTPPAETRASRTPWCCRYQPGRRSNVPTPLFYFAQRKTMLDRGGDIYPRTKLTMIPSWLSSVMDSLQKTIFTSPLPILWWTCIIPLLLVLASLTRVRYRSDMRIIPGPFLASITNLWRLVAVHRGRFDVSLQALHEKHGDLVRVGPNCISVANAYEIGKIYGITRLFPKVFHFPWPIFERKYRRSCSCVRSLTDNLLISQTFTKCLNPLSTDNGWLRFS